MVAGVLLLYRLALQGWGTLSSTLPLAPQTSLVLHGKGQQITSLEPVIPWVPVHVPEFNTFIWPSVIAQVCLV